MFKWLLNRWRERQRAIDIALLWPVFRQQATDIDKARRGFMLHATHDPAWRDLGADKIREIVDGLK